jgi:uncharacterized protein (UPF0333 family)
MLLKLHKRGQLSIELALLMTAIILGGAVVGYMMLENPSFNNSNVDELKDVSFSGFAGSADSSDVSSTSSTTTVSLSSSASNAVDLTTSSSSASNNSGSNADLSSMNSATSTITYIVSNTTVDVSGNGHVELLGDGLVNYTLLNISNLGTISGWTEGDYSVFGSIDSISMHISGHADITIHNIESIDNLDLSVRGTGNSDMNAIMENVIINNANIESHGGGTSSNIYITNSHIESANILAKGGAGNDEANIFITNTTINSANFNVEGANAKIEITDSFINNNYVNTTIYKGQ